MGAKRGYIHSAIPDPSSFVLGISSEEEIAVVAEALHPTADKVVKGYLVDVIDGVCGGPELVLRTLAGAEYTRSVPIGTFIINATDNLNDSANCFDPVVDESGLVLNPQYLCGFSGPSANLCTHAWFSG